MKKLISMGLCVISSTCFAQPVATVLFVTNKAVAVRAGAEIALTRGATLEVGDAINTAGDAVIKFKYENGTLVALGNNSRYTILAYSPKQSDVQVSAELTSGQLESKTTRKTNESLKTPTTALAVVGTAYKVSVVCGSGNATDCPPPAIPAAQDAFTAAEGAAEAVLGSDVSEAKPQIETKPGDTQPKKTAVLLLTGMIKAGGTPLPRAQTVLVDGSKITKSPPGGPDLAKNTITAEGQPVLNLEETSASRSDPVPGAVTATMTVAAPPAVAPTVAAAPPAATPASETTANTASTTQESSTATSGGSQEDSGSSSSSTTSLSNSPASEAAGVIAFTVTGSIVTSADSASAQAAMADIVVTVSPCG